MNLLDKLERKIGWLTIPGLMHYIVLGNAFVYIIQMVLNVDMDAALAFDWNLILRGQVWRIFSFVFIPPTIFGGSVWNVVIAALIFMFYYSIGRKTEMAMGSFAFTIYYLVGMLGVIFFGVVFRVPVTGDYLNSAIFFAYAYYFPDDLILVMMILPVKIKYMAFLSGALLLASFVMGNFYIKILIFTGMINFILFFGKSLVIDRLINRRRKSVFRSNSQGKRRAGFKAKVYTNPNYGKSGNVLHCCEVCGRTERDAADLEFRYCSSCEGYHEYCMEHLHNHIHKKEGEA